MAPLTPTMIGLLLVACVAAAPINNWKSGIFDPHFDPSSLETIRPSQITGLWRLTHASFPAEICVMMDIQEDRNGATTVLSADPGHGKIEIGEIEFSLPDGWVIPLTLTPRDGSEGGSLILGTDFDSYLVVADRTESGITMIFTRQTSPNMSAIKQKGLRVIREYGALENLHTVTQSPCNRRY
jgi:hypothetical protein